MGPLRHGIRIAKIACAAVFLAVLACIAAIEIWGGQASGNIPKARSNLRQLVLTIESCHVDSDDHAPHCLDLDELERREPGFASIERGLLRISATSSDRGAYLLQAKHGELGWFVERRDESGSFERKCTERPVSARSFDRVRSIDFDGCDREWLHPEQR